MPNLYKWKNSLRNTSPAAFAAVRSTVGLAQRVFAAEAQKEKQIREALVYGLRLRHGRVAPSGSALEAFLAFAFARTESYGQLFQDMFALWVNEGHGPGYFLEIGVGDGINLSNTYALERAGWSGLLCEANPRFVASIKKCRTARIDQRAVYSRSGERLTFNVAQMGEFSQLEGARADVHSAASHRAVTEAVTVDSVTFDDLLAQNDAPATIGFLSMDIEGGEIDALSGFDFARHRFRAATIEHNFSNEAAIDALMLGNGYVRVFRSFTAFDAWYVDRDCPLLRTLRWDDGGIAINPAWTPAPIVAPIVPPPAAG